MDPKRKHGVIAPIERSPYIGAASDAASGVRTFLNKAAAPVVRYATRYAPQTPDVPVGDFLVGEAPEELDRWAHGFTPFKDRNAPGYSGLRIPEIQEKRAGPVADTLFLGADVAGVGAGTALLGKAGLRSAGQQLGQQFQRTVSDEAMDPSRRKFIKNAGIVGAGATAAAATPDIVKAGLRAMKPSGTTAATRVAKSAFATFPEYTARIRALDSLRPAVVDQARRSIRDADDAYQAMAKRSKEAWQKARDEWELKQEYLAPEDRFNGDFDDWMETNGSGGYIGEEDFVLENMHADISKEASDRWYAYRNAEEAALREANPEWAKKLDDFNKLELEWRSARTDAIGYDSKVVNPNGPLPATDRRRHKARLRKLAEVDAKYKKRMKDDFGVLIDDADVMEQFKYGKENYVDPITGLEPVMKFTPDGRERLEWSRSNFLNQEGMPTSWEYKHWVADEPIPNSDQIIEEILKAEAFTGPAPPKRSLRDINEIPF
jgi:hypothetical protein